MRRTLLLLMLLLVGACTSQPTPAPNVPPTRTLAPLPTLLTLTPLVVSGTSVPTLTTPPLVEETLSPTSATAVASPLPSLAPAPAASLPPAVTEPITSFPALIGSLDPNAPGVTLRAEPSSAAQTVATLPAGSFVHAQRRTSDSAWVEVVTEQGVIGWVEARDISALETITLLPTAIPPTAVPTFALGDIPSMERRLNDTPLFQNLTGERIRQIFAAGQGMGNRANVFTTIGDSNTTNGDFLQPIGMGADVYCDWGDYADLNASVAYFSVPPTSDNRAANSFTHHSLAAKMGFNSAAVLDPFWATSAVCERGESPLACELRSVKPSVAIIMLGGIDINRMDTAEYGANMRAIVETSIAQGVIPVLTTFVVLPERGTVYERSLEFNMMLLDIASAERTPLVNLWSAAQPLPDHGIGPDRTHLKAVVGSFCSFDGDQERYGGTLRNLLTLQVLDTLRRNVLTR